MDFSWRLKLVMFDRELSNQELAVKLETSKSQISRWVNGHIRPRTSTVRKIADVYDVSFEWLEEDKGTPIFKGNDLVIIPDEETRPDDSLRKDEIKDLNSSLNKLERDLYNMGQEENKRHEQRIDELEDIKKHASSLRSIVGGTSLLELLNSDKT